MAKNNNIECIHCGDDCGSSPVMWMDKPFCCNGCKTVYQILNENKLYNYYNLDNKPGIKVETSNVGDKYAFLDNEDVKKRFISFEEGGIAKVKFYIPVIHCASCIWLLENLNKLNLGVKYAFVNFPKKEVDITFDTTILSLRQLVELLSSIHYIPDLSYDAEEKKKGKNVYKKLLYKIGIAGFVFINVMTYSLPAYFNGKLLDPELQYLFNILSYILVIPVVFYSGNDYFISAYKNLRKGVVSIDLPIALGISVLFLVTSYEVIFIGGPGYSDSLSGLIFFLLVGRWYQSKTYESLSFDRNYKSYFPIAVTKINKQLEESILLEKIVKDDVLIIRNKELIPADSILVEGDAKIDYSFVTGESTPVQKNKGDFLYAGGRQVGGIIKIQVQKKVNQSHLTKLWNQDKSYEKPTDLLKSLSDRISKYFTIIIILLATAGLTYWLLNGDARTAFYVFSAVLIVACPCALALSIPFTFGNTMRIFGKEGFYIKNTDVIERLSHIDTIVFDKTGTLTKPNENKTEYFGRTLTDHELHAVYSIAKQSSHPLSTAIADLYHNDATYYVPQHFVEMAGKGIYGEANNLTIKLGSQKFVTGKTNDSIKATNVFLSIDNEPVGHFIIRNQYRDGFEDIIKSLQKEFELYIVSGDNSSEKEFLTQYFKEENIYFNQKPADKAAIIKKLQSEGKKILMTGDGLNDAGALMQSDVALTIANKVYHFSPASDAVLESNQFSKLARFIKFTHKSISILKVSFAISFLYNIIGISIALTGNLSPVIAAILMPISSISVVAFATFATRLAFRVK